MSTILTIPTLISQHDHGVFVAKAMLFSDDEAQGATAREAFQRLERHFKKQAARGNVWAFTRIKEMRYQEHAVVVRIAERDKKRIINFGPKIKLKVRCVFSLDEEDQTWCSLPDWDIGFVCDATRDEKSQVVELVRQQFANLTTDELLLRMLPMASEVRAVKLRLAEQIPAPVVVYRPLDLVAEPMSIRNRKAGSQLAWHRDQEIEQLTRQMRESGSSLIVGDTGCGKSTIIRVAAGKYQELEREESLSQGRKTALPPLVWRTTASDLIAGMQYLGQWEERLEQVIEKLAELNAILFVDSLVELVRVGGRSPEDSLAAFMLPYLRRGELRLISEATHETLDACRRLLPGFAESFRIVPVSRLSTEATQDIASRILQEAKRNHRIDAEEPCAATAVGLYKRYLPYLSPPKGPVTLLQRMVSESRKTNATSISNAQVLDRFSRETGLPPHIICDSIRIKPQELKQHFDAEVIGQPEATTVAVDTIVKLKAGLVDPQRPVATLLFCGPTGVGKTQLAQSIADYVLASKGGSGGSLKAKNDRLVRLDMSEYQSWGAVDRLLMTSQGEPALWIQRLRTWPLGVLLFDEFEKAAPEVFDCLLSAFDEGRITDRFGRTTTLCGTIIVLTSNVGANQSASTGFVNDQSRRYARALEQTFRPEFLNRLDAITTFQPLSRETTRLIVEKELRAINDRPAMRERQLELRWPSELVDQLAEVGFDPALGARPLQRAIERVVVAPLAKWLLSCETHQRIIEWDEVSAKTRETTA